MENPRFVVLLTNNEGGVPARLAATLEDAKAIVREFLFDPDLQPPMTADERAVADQEIEALSGLDVESIRGSAAWKEWVYVAPLER